MNRILLMLLSVFPLAVAAQDVKLEIKNRSNQVVKGASVLVDGKWLGESDSNGLFNLDLSQYSTDYIEVLAQGYNQSIIQVDKSNSLSTFSIILEPDNTFLDDIVITSGRKAELISTVPSSISVLSAKDIQTQNQFTTNLTTMLGNLVPGLAVSTNKTDNIGQTLRGRPLIILIDGIPQSTPLMPSGKDFRSIDPFFLQRIEVIKGATSMYGNGATGGVINYITKKPVKNEYITGNTFVGSSFQPFSASGTLGYRVAQSLSGRYKKIAYSFGFSRDYNGLERDGKGVILGQKDGLSNNYQNNIFTQLYYDINDDSTLKLFYNFYSNEQKSKYITQDGIYGKEPAIGVKGDSPGKNTGTPANNNLMLSYNNNNLFAGTQFDLTAYYQQLRTMDRYIESTRLFYGSGQPEMHSDKKGVRANFNTSLAAGQTSLELTYGVDVLNDVTSQVLTDGRTLIPEMRMFNVAPYLQIKVDLFDNLIFKGGMRYENATVKVKDYTTLATGPNNQGSVNVKGGEIPYKTTLFNAGLRYNKYDFFNPFVSFSQGFSISELGRILRRATENTLSAIETKPIITNNYEIGFSSRFSIFNLTATYFISTSKYGATLNQVGGTYVIERSPEKIHGFETSVDAYISDQLTVGGSYAYIEGKSEYESNKNVYIPHSRISPSKLTAYINYKPTEKLNIQLSYLRTGGRDHFAPDESGEYRDGEAPITPINLFNLVTSYHFSKKFSVNLGIENLFNSDYYTIVSQYRAQNEYYVKGRGSVLNLNLNYNF